MIDRETFEQAKQSTRFLYLFDELRGLREDIKGHQRIDRYVAIVSGALGGIGAFLVVTGKLGLDKIISLFS